MLARLVHQCRQLLFAKKSSSYLLLVYFGARQRPFFLCLNPPERPKLPRSAFLRHVRVLTGWHQGLHGDALHVAQGVSRQENGAYAAITRVKLKPYRL